VEVRIWAEHLFILTVSKSVGSDVSGRNLALLMLASNAIHAQKYIYYFKKQPEFFNLGIK